MISIFRKGSFLVLSTFFLTFAGIHHGYAQVAPAYKDASLPVETRVADLLSKMTPEEKFFQLFMIPGDLSIGKEKLKTGIFGLQVSALGAGTDAASQMLNYGRSGSAVQFADKINRLQKYFIDESRLGIPIIPFEEALHGLIGEDATVFPQSIGLAASFNCELMHEVAKVIAGQARSRGIRQVLSPVLNIARDVRWGRTEETYGEDPYLVSQMGFAYISEFEKAGVIATPKHFAVNSGDGGRDSYPVHLSGRLMEEVYFPAFKTAILKAGARSLMTAYNSFDGSPCSASNWLLNKKLKQDWGFRGFVISDASAVGGANVLHFTAADYDDAGKQAIENGLDVIFQTSYNHAELFSGPFLSGKVRQGAIDSAVGRVLRAKFELGLFDHPYVDTAEARRSNLAGGNHELTLMAARESIVLLKNEGNVLPIGQQVKTIALIGPDATEARLGGYSGQGNGKVSILEGMRRTAPQGTTVLYEPGCGRETSKYVVVPADNLCTYGNGFKSPGLYGEYFNSTDLYGKPKITRIDETINFAWTLYSPDPAILFDWYSIRWMGKIFRGSTGKCRIGVEGNDGYRLYLNNKLVIDNWVKKSYGTRLTDFSFIKGKEYDIRLEYYESTGNARLKLVWDAGVPDTATSAISKSVELARRSDLAVVVAGITEGEFRDRSSLKLPGRQEELINAIASTGKPIVVVLVGGSAVTMSNWIDQVQGITDVWYPGEAGGIAVAEVLFGIYNPAGRLPVTFPMAEGQLPLVYNHKPTGRGDDYNDLSGMPLFPFGHGLSYTSFAYSNLLFDKTTIHAGDSVQVHFKVTNTGRLAGDEVCQLYIRDELASVARPVAELKGFARLRLSAGETKEQVFTINGETLNMLDANMLNVVEPGTFRIMIGSSSEDIRLRGILNVIK